jgi:LytS/YehU family sensor histidine kinase
MWLCFQGPMLYFFNIFSEKFSEKLAFLLNAIAKLCKILIITFVFEKNAYFSPKIVKNCIVPWKCFTEAGFSLIYIGTYM